LPSMAHTRMARRLEMPRFLSDTLPRRIRIREVLAGAVAFEVQLRSEMLSATYQQ
jgi:hypothetical protein